MLVHIPCLEHVPRGTSWQGLHLFFLSCFHVVSFNRSGMFCFASSSTYFSLPAFHGYFAGRRIVCVCGQNQNDAPKKTGIDVQSNVFRVS